MTAERTARASVLVAVSGAAIGVIFGYDLGSIAGALPGITREFGLSPLAAGWVNGVVVLSQLLGALVAGRLNDRFGRRRTMIGVAGGYAVVAVLQSVATDVVMLDVVRVGLGLTIGVSMVAAPLYVAEISPARLRGRFVAMYQVACVGGIFITYLVNYLLSFGGGWRLMLGLAAVPAVLVLGCLVVLPESPRWLVLVGRDAEAAEVLRRTDPAAADAGLAGLVAEVRSEIARTGSLRDLWAPRYRRATVFVVLLGVFAQLTGINAITYYSPTVFAALGFDTAGSYGWPTVVQFFAVLATIGSLFVVDRLGRRFTLLTGLTSMAVAALTLSAVFWPGQPTGAGPWIGFAAALVFTCAFSGGFGSVVWVYAAEAYPVQLRATGSSLMLVSAMLANVVVAEGFLWAAAGPGMGAVFGFFAAVGAVAVAYLAVRAPETAGQSLEQAHHQHDR
ncbi:sugar porter family MFS transporter [Actinomycetes bacterium KLBMP 9759]